MSIKGLNISDIASQTTVKTGVGTMSPNQVGTLLAQQAKEANLSATEISATGAVGKYGLTPSELEKNGYLKPGLLDRYGNDPTKMESLLRSPGAWTGKDGIESVSNVLNNEKLQTTIKTESLNTSLNELTSSGLLTGTESPEVIGSLTSVTSKFNIDSVGKWLNNSLPADMSLSMDSIARGAQYATEFVDSKMSALFGGTSKAMSSLFSGSAAPQVVVPKVASQTVNRDAIDDSMRSLIGNAKVPAPNYTGLLDQASAELPSLSGIPVAGVDMSGPVEVCECSDPTLIGPNKEECEDAGGVWTCRIVNNSNNPPTTLV